MQDVRDLVNFNHDLVSHKLFEVVSQKNSCLVSRLFMWKYVNGVEIGVECAGTIESSCPVSKMLEKFIDISLLCSFDGAPTGYLHACPIVQTERDGQFFVTRQFCWADWLTAALKLVIYACAGNHKSELYYGNQASYHVIGSHNGGSLTSYFSKYKYLGLAHFPASRSWILLTKAPQLQISFCLVVYANTRTLMWDPGWQLSVYLYSLAAMSFSIRQGVLQRLALAYTVSPSNTQICSKFSPVRRGDLFLVVFSVLVFLELHISKLVFANECTILISFISWAVNDRIGHDIGTNTQLLLFKEFPGALSMGVTTDRVLTKCLIRAIIMLLFIVLFSWDSTHSKEHCLMPCTTAVLKDAINVLVLAVHRIWNGALNFAELKVAGVYPPMPLLLGVLDLNLEDKVS